MKICIIQSKCRFLFVLGQLWMWCIHVSNDMWFNYALCRARRFISGMWCYVYRGYFKGRSGLLLVVSTSLICSIDLTFKTNTKSSPHQNRESFKWKTVNIVDSRCIMASGVTVRRILFFSYSSSASRAFVKNCKDIMADILYLCMESTQKTKATSSMTACEISVVHYGVSVQRH